MYEFPIYSNTREVQQHESELKQAVTDVLTSGCYINGPQVQQLEHSLSAYVGRDACGVASGTEALKLLLQALNVGPGDEVVVPALTHYSTAEAVLSLGASVRVADVDSSFNMSLSSMLTQLSTNTKAVILVSLYGRVPETQAYRQTLPAKISLIEDGAQSFGASNRQGHKSGNLPGTVAACTSFYPTKPLGGCGDGGAIFTDDAKLMSTIRALRIHGHQESDGGDMYSLVGTTGRLDEIQAAYLNVRFSYFDNELLQGRQQVAQWYAKYLNAKYLTLPRVSQRDAYAQFVVMLRRDVNRDKLVIELRKASIQVRKYYEHGLHEQPKLQPQEACPVADVVCDQCLALPLDPYFTEHHVALIAQKVNRILHDQLIGNESHPTAQPNKPKRIIAAPNRSAQ